MNADSTQWVDSLEADSQLSSDLSSGPDAIPSGGTTASYLHALRRHWPIALLLGLLSAAAVTTFFPMRAPQRYAATAVLRMSMSDRPLIFETADVSRQNSFEIYKRTQKQLILSRAVLAAAVRDERVATHPVIRRHADAMAWLASELTVSFPDDAEIVQVQLAGDDPRGLADVVNAVVQAYMDQIVLAEQNRRVQRLSTLKQVYSDTEARLNAKRADLREFAGSDAAGDPQARLLVQQSLLQQRGGVQNRLAELQVERRRCQRDLQALKLARDREADLATGAEIDAAMNLDPLAADLVRSRDDFANVLRQTQERLAPGKEVPMVQELKQRIAATERKLQERRDALLKALAEKQRRELEERSQKLETSLVFLAEQENELQESLRALDNEASQLGKSASAVKTRLTEIQGLEAALGSMSEEIARTEIELRHGGDQSLRVAILSPAEQPRQVSSPPQLAQLAGGTSAAILFPVALVVWWDVRKRRINTAKEVAHGLGLNVLGSVPLVPRGIMRRPNRTSRRSRIWRKLLSESIDSIAALLLSSEPPGKRVILVSSATAGEGKTTLAAHLAKSLAGSGQRVLLVDFDLRRPALHRVLSLGLAPGASEVLRKDCSLGDAIQATGVPNLSLVSAGRWWQAGMGFLTSSTLKELFATFRSQFDFVIVDGSPILPVADTRLVGRHADAVILSVLRDVSEAPKVRAACDILEQFRIPLLGVVVTGDSHEIYRQLYPDSSP